MKKITKILSLLVIPLVFIYAFFSGCKKIQVEIDNGSIMQDIDKKPTQTAAYEQHTKQAIQEYENTITNNKTANGEVDLENEQVKKTANMVAAKLFAYACYNERQLDKYVFFSDQNGDTDLGASGYAKAQRQEYYLRINESEKTCGYRYHYTIKKVKESGGVVSAFKNLFESARLRVTDKTNLLYRFEGSKLEDSGVINEKLDCSLLSCEWKTGKDWGKPDIEMKKSEYIAPEKIEEDIINNAGNDNITIRGNINIFAEDVVSSTTMLKDDEGGYVIAMILNTQVANRDESSLKMLRNGNSSDDCVWTDGEEDSGLVIVFRIWENGLFRFLRIDERWKGKLNKFDGVVESQTEYYFSYSDRDCDMTENLQMLENAKVLKEKGE